MKEPLDVENLMGIRGSRLSYRAWFVSTVRERGIIEMAFAMMCDSITLHPQLDNGTHPLYADVMRCVVTPPQDLSTLIRQDTRPKPMQTIVPDITIYFRPTATTYQTVLRAGTREAVIREIPR